MALPEILSHAVAGWARFYGDHRIVSVTVRYLHLAGLLVGGGTAVALDRRVLAARRLLEPERSAVLDALEASHRVVVPAIGLVMLTGALMTASDTTTFFASRLYWSKMALVTLLLANGAGLFFAEARARQGGGWTWLRTVSAASLALWLIILYVGAWLTAAA
jgi:hypothetical protein